MALRKIIILLLVGGVGISLFLSEVFAESSSSDLLQAEKAVRTKQFGQAFALYLQAAKAGNAEAQYHVANLYLLGRGVNKSETQASYWLEKSAQQAHPSAQYALGLRLVKTQAERAKTLIKSASQQGYEPARYFLARQKKIVTRAEADKALNNQERIASWFGATRNGNLIEMKALHSQINNIDAQDVNGRTALFEAVSANRVKTANWLLMSGAKVEHADRFGVTPLSLAISNNNQSMLTLLLAHTKKASISFVNGDNLLHYAIRMRNQESALYLIEKNIGVNESNSEGWTPLDLAEYMGLNRVVSLLKSKSAQSGNAWLNKNEISTNERIAEAWTNSSSIHQFGKGELCQAVIAGNVPLVMKLLQLNPSWLNQPFDDGSGVASLAIQNRNSLMLKTLLELGADPNQLGPNNRPLILLAAQQGQVESFRALVKAGADPLQQSDEGQDVLSIAIQMGHIDLFKEALDLIVKNKRNVPVHDYILIAGKYNQTEFIDFLSQQFDFTRTKKIARDDRGRSALWYAAYHCNVASTDTLLRSNKEFNQADEWGKSPFIIAVENDCSEVAQRLRQSSDINQTTQNGNTALMVAANSDHEELVRWLVKEGVEVDARNTKGDTALIMAVRANSEDSVKILLEADANISRKNKSGFSALDLAQNNKTILTMLKDKSVLGIF